MSARLYEQARPSVQPLSGVCYTKSGLLRTCVLSQSPPTFAIRAVALLAHVVYPVQCLHGCTSKLVHPRSRCPGLFVTSILMTDIIEAWRF